MSQIESKRIWEIGREGREGGVGGDHAGFWERFYNHMVLMTVITWLRYSKEVVFYSVI